MTKQETAQLLASIFALWPSQARHLTQDEQMATARVWATMLEDVDYSAANAAVTAMAHTSRFMPTIAEIREAVLELEVGPVRPGGDAWGDVLAAVHRYGIYRRPKFTDPVTARCVDMLGWEEICNSEMQASDRARFIELYDRYAVENRRCAQSPILAAAKYERTKLGGPTSVKALLEALNREPEKP